MERVKGEWFTICEFKHYQTPALPALRPHCSSFAYTEIKYQGVKNFTSVTRCKVYSRWDEFLWGFFKFPQFSDVPFDFVWIKSHLA